jgi:hypothetical protein
VQVIIWFGTLRIKQGIGTGNFTRRNRQVKIEAYRGTVSLPFGPGEHKRIAVKIVDDRGIESLKVMGVGE